jgi:hypothetical protein
VNVQPDATGSFKWQEGYGVLSFGDRAMSDVVAYVKNQRQHHQHRTPRQAFERISDDEDGVEVVFLESP